MSYGSAWGSDAWGNGPDDEQSTDFVVSDTIDVTDTTTFTMPLRVSEAVALNSNSVRVTFSNPLDLSYSPLSDPANYTIPGLTVFSVVELEVDAVVLNTSGQISNQLYTVTVAQAISLNGDTLGSDDSENFLGFISTTTFLAGAEGPTKVEVVFSGPMLVNADLTNPASYTITAVTGSLPIAVASATLSGAAPYRRVTLSVGPPALESKEYYAIELDPGILDLAGNPVNPRTYIFQWADMSAPTTRPLEIPIEHFSGEVVGGILGEPDGLVFFSPAYSSVPANSTIEVEEVSVCTKAYDEYQFPQIPDPEPLYTWRSGIQSVISPTNVLWAPAPRLGLARLDQSLLQREDFYPPVYDPATATLESPISDSPVTAILVEPINISCGGFLNDARWELFPASGATNFSVANNLAPVGPGPTVTPSLFRRLDILDPHDILPVSDSVLVEEI